ncbi:MAG TPA: CHAT domain-containing protein [Anaerolineales bacterium]|nr:CHAT domain-containing protein [Anaerolineales bacterium]
MERLKESLGPAWRDEWLANGLPGVPRLLLSLALTEGLEAVQRKMQEQAAAELERLRQENPEAYRQLESAARQFAEAAPLLQTLQEFIQADTWAESQRIVKAHPELLEARTDILLEQLIQAARGQGDENAVRLLEEHRALLRRCREVGIARAFAEKMLPSRALAAAEAAGLTPEQALEMARQAAQLPPELREVLEELARRSAPIRSAEDLERALEEHPELREKLERRVSQAQAESALDRRFQELIALQQQAENAPALWLQVVQGWQDLIAQAEAQGKTWLAANARGNLGNACINLYQITGDDSWANQAAQLLSQIQTVFNRQEAPQGWATVQHSLGNLFLDRYERSGEDAHAQAAEEHYRNILALSKEVFLPAIYPFRASAALSRLHFRCKDWQACREDGEQAFSSLEELLAAGLTRGGKATWLREARGLAAQVGWAWLQAGKPEQAVFSLERGRAVLLREGMGRLGCDLERLPEVGFATLYKRFVRARQEEEGLAALLEGQGALAHVNELTAARRELQETAEAIRRQAGEKHPEYRFFLKSLPFQVIQSLAQEAPLVYLAATAYGGFALVVRAGADVNVLDLPELTEEALREKVVGPKDDPAISGYLGAYWRWRNNPRNEPARQAWFGALDAMLTWLGQAVMSPLVARLEALGVPQGSVVRLIPGGWLGLLPLHASRTTARRTTASSCPYALDHYTFTYLPSAQALYHARAAAERPAESLLLVDNPDGSLVFSSQEAEGVRDVFPEQAIKMLKGKHATKERVRQAMSQAEVLHFSTHGRAGWTESERAGVLLAEGEWLTLPEIFDLRLEKPRLAVLSACETGVPTLKNPDEVEALPSGLMQAGIPGVVGSLWAVNDLSTALLMAWFYHFWRKEGTPLPQALRRAQCYLRDAFRSDTVRAELEALSRRAGWRMASEQAEDFLNLVTLRDFAHPYYWAGFTYTGL